jgi:PhnB protein
MDRVEAVVVGAGVVGLAVARALAMRGLETLVLERENAIGTGISSRNSEVIHAGLYYPPGSLKARLCVEGAEFWVADESPEHKNFSPETLNGSTARIVLVVKDPDAVFARAVAAGATSVYPVHEDYGWRLGRLMDPYGHHWEIGKPLSAGL